MKAQAGAVLVGLVVAASASVASAEPEVTVEHRRPIVAVPLLALSKNAFALQGEMPVARHLSVALAFGVADAADGDFDAQSGSLGGELRLWLSARQRWFFVAPRLEGQIMHSSITSEDRSLGTGYTLTEGVVVGCRFVIFDHVEITPTAGIVEFHDFGTERVATMSRTTFGMGLEAGWIF